MQEHQLILMIKPPKHETREIEARISEMGGLFNVVLLHSITRIVTSHLDPFSTVRKP
jgi:hypothetical protein